MNGGQRYEIEGEHRQNKRVDMEIANFMHLYRAQNGIVLPPDYGSKSVIYGKRAQLNVWSRSTARTYCSALSHRNSLKTKAHKSSSSFSPSSPLHPKSHQTDLPITMSASISTPSLSTTSTTTSNNPALRRLAHRVKDATLECLAAAILRIIDPTARPEKLTPRHRFGRRRGKKTGHPYACASGRGFKTGSFVDSWDEIWESVSGREYSVFSLNFFVLCFLD